MKNEKKFRKNMKLSTGFFIILFSILILYMGYFVIRNGTSWYATPYNPRIANARSNIRGGTIYDRNGVKLAWSQDSKRQYNETKEIRRACSHVVGDIYGKSIGIETTYAKQLYGLENDLFTLIQRFISGDYKGKNGKDITLTIDSELSRFIYKEMKGRRGSVVVMNYKTGEIISSVSILTFDPSTVNKDKLEDTALVDRATMGRYPPGSIMKIVTASRAIDMGISMEYECTGETVIGGQKVTCKYVHGKQNLEEAFANSCNTYFAELSVKIGGGSLLSQAEKFKFNRTFKYSDFTLYRSNFEVSSEKGDIAWAGIGQYNDLITPTHAALMVSAVANDGVMPEPKLVRKVGDTDNMSWNLISQDRIISSATSRKLKEMMKKAVDEGTGTSAKIPGFNVYGKTGTAEYVEDGKVENHSWFGGFLDEDKPYAIAVILEGAGFGSSAAAPLAKKIFEYIILEASL